MALESSNNVAGEPAEADDLILQGLIEDLQLSRSSLHGAETERKELESSYGLRIKLLEQSIRRRELRMQHQAQVAEQGLKDRELRLKERASRIDKWANPLTVGVIVAALGLVGNFVNGLWSNLNQQAQLQNQQVTEKIKLQNDLIKEAIKPATEEDRAKSLVFFAKNKLIALDKDVVAALVQSAGTDRPVPGSSSAISTSPSMAVPLAFQPAIVERVRANPTAGIPADLPLLKDNASHLIAAIILHDAVGPDASEAILKNGRSDLRGPLAHWLVKSDGTIVMIAPETVKAAHLGNAKDGLTNANTIGVMVSGQPALQDQSQVESLVRLVTNIMQRWNLPADKIYSHGEVALPPGRKTDMLQQAPLVREMVRAAQSQANR